MKIEFFKKKNNFNKKKSTPSPDLYWKFTVIGAFTIILVSFIFGYHLFMNIDQQTMTGVDTVDSLQSPKIDDARLQKALNYFSERQNKSNEILNNPVPVVDPAL